MRSLYLLPMLCIVSCSTPKQEHRTVLPGDVRIVSRLIVHNEKNSPRLEKCGTGKRFFKDAGSFCTFWLGNMEFDIEYKYVLNENGRIKEYWPYIAEGPYVIDDSLNLAQSVEKDFRIHLSNDREYVIDCGDTLAITHIFENEQLLFTERSPKTTAGRRWVYHYR